MIKAVHLGSQSRLTAHDPVVKPVTRREIDVAIVAPKLIGNRLYSRLVEELFLPLDYAKSHFMAIVHERHRGVYVIIGKVRVLSFQTQFGKQRL